MLARARLGDHAGLAHALREERLAEHLVRFVGAAVQQVLALEVVRRLRALRKAREPRERRRTARIGRQQAVELRPEGGIVRRVDVGALELVEGGKEKLGDELAAVLAEVGIEQHDGDSFFEFGSV